ncbi:MAG: AAA family ATPase [bacterium]|nr:AAA family ATPase [bacterium]
MIENMKLLRLDIHGFKSFAQPTTLVFTPPRSHTPVPVTAIVGPNGSGKSNIVDAIRWVLGEQSMKSIRSKRSEDVIFAGSGTRSRQGVAEVTLTLENDVGNTKELASDDELLAILRNAPEISIGRHLDREGASEYSLCNKHVRLGDVQLFLAHANFGQGSYAIIGQGTIDSLLTSRPQELRELFEEASGVKVYRLKRERALQKIAATRENLHEADIRLQSLRPRKNSLERQVERFRKRKHIEDELNEKRNRYYAGRLQQLGSKFDELKKGAERYEKERSDRLFALEKAKRTFTLFAETDQTHVKHPLEQQLATLLEKERTLHGKALELARGSHAPSPATLTWRDRIGKILTAWKKLREQLASEGATDAVRDTLDHLFEDLDSTLHEHPTPPPLPTVTAEERAVQEDLGKVQKEITAIQNSINTEAQKHSEERRAVFAAQQDLQKNQNLLREVDGQLNQIQIERARLEAHEEDLLAEIKDTLGLNDPKTALRDVASAQPSELETIHVEIQRLTHSAELAGSIDPSIEEEYEQVKQETDFLETNVADLVDALQKTEQVVAELEKHIKEQFDVAFKTINKTFDSSFQTLFNGGSAHLEEIAASEEGEGGIEIIATPPGKRIKHISMLSGGERTLAGIALICAIISHNAPPFVVLDEVDAALDEANTRRFADILKTLSQKTQFLVITHNRVTMEVADLLYGVTMGDEGVSRLLSLHLADAVVSART